MKLNTLLALIGTLIAVASVLLPHVVWLLALAVVLIGVAYLVAPN